MLLSTAPAPAPKAARAGDELGDVTRRFWVAVVLNLWLMMAGVFPALDPLLLFGTAHSDWTRLAFTTPVVLWCGAPFFTRAWAAFMLLRYDDAMLTALGTGLAWAYSVTGMAAAEIMPASLRLPSGEVPLFFEAAAGVMTLVLFANVLELRARAYASRAIRALRPTLARAVAEAHRSRPAVQRVADGIARQLVAASLAAAVLSATIWSLWGPPPALAYALLIAVSVLLVACPRAVAQAARMAVIAGLGRGASEGLVFRDAAALEALARVDALVIDRAGARGGSRALASDAIVALHALGIHTVVVGDAAGAAYDEALAVRDAAHAIQRLRGEGRRVAVAGAYATAPDESHAACILLGSGESPPATPPALALASNDLLGVARALGLARRATRCARQNLRFAVAYNAIALPLAMGVLFPFFGLLLPPVLAGAAMSLAWIAVVANAQRLRAIAL